MVGLVDGCQRMSSDGQSAKFVETRVKFCIVVVQSAHTFPRSVAERVGFEPTMSCPIPHFEL